MTKAKDRTDYRARLARVITYIYDHMDEDIDLNKLADVACLSPYHWHRVYHGLYGETLAATVKRLRLHRAGAYLANSDMPIDEIAVKSGYTSAQGFTRAFTQAYNMPPAEYRRTGNHAQFQENIAMANAASYPVSIKTLPALRFAGLDHRGSYMLIGKAFETVFGWFASQGHFNPGGLFGKGAQAIGIYLDDPNAIAEDDLRSKAGMVVPATFKIDAPLIEAAIPGGDYAVLRHKGPYAELRSAYQWLYGTWLVQSGHEAADAPVFEEYINNPRDVAPQDLITDIHLPLRLEK